jgi:SAM-dependent methyltransferase
MNILAVIANYGSRNDGCLQRLLEEYRASSYRIHVVVLSNIPKDLGSDIEVRVGLPTKDPYSLPFGHKLVFAEMANRFDLFIYSEDDILIRDENIDAFIQQSRVLPPELIPGFLRFEERLDGKRSYCDFHAGYCWDSQSVEKHGDKVFAYFYNLHAACFLLTREHLRRAIDSGGFLVEPHSGKYDIRETAATDPYTQCGFKKMICISELDRASVHHLPNAYLGRFGIDEGEMKSQVGALLRLQDTMSRYEPLIQVAPGLKGGRYLREHFAPARTDILTFIDGNVRNVLSLGCGATEIALAERGLEVVAIPVDPTVSATGANKGVEIVSGDLKSVADQLEGRSFDCVLLIDVLHLVKQPVSLIACFMRFLNNGGKILVSVPSIRGFRFLWGWLTRGEGRKSYFEAGIRIVSPGIVRKWLKEAGAVSKILAYVPANEGLASRLPRRGIVSRLVAKEVLVQARQNDQPDLHQTHDR